MAAKSDAQGEKPWICFGLSQ